MIIPLIVMRSMRQHALSTAVTALSVALAGGLMMAVWAVKEQSLAAFTQVNAGFDGVLGARGSKLQLVLNSIFHLEASPGNLRLEDYEEVRRHRAVRLAVPIAAGDNYRGHRVVGTTAELFTEAEHQPGRKLALREGRLFAPEADEAVVGSFVAEKLGLKLGDEFHPFHGLNFNEENQHAEEYRVVGILEPSNSPIDKVLWIPLHGIQTMTGHDPGKASEISAVLIQLSSPVAGFALDAQYNRQGDRLTFAFPISAIVAEFLGKIGWFDRVLGLVAYLVGVVSVAGVLVAIYNSMTARRRDIAILRALGASRVTIFSAIVAEAAAIGAVGMAAAFVVYGAIMVAVAAVIRAQTGVVLDPAAPNAMMLAVPLAMIALCALSGAVPAWKAYRTDVAANLLPVS